MRPRLRYRIEWRRGPGRHGAALPSPTAAAPVIILIFSLFSSCDYRSSHSPAPQCTTDEDQDGVAAASCGGRDCDDDNPWIHPWAEDPCGDGIDQNCDGYDVRCNEMFTEVGEEMGLNDSHTGRGVALVDLDGDGDLDVFVAGNGQDMLYLNEGGVFSRVDGEMGMSEDSGGRGVAAGDYDNDGDLDFFVANWEDQQDFLYRNDGDTFHRSDVEAGLADDSNGCGPAFGDYDNDGDLDLFVSNYMEDRDFLYRNDGGTFTRVGESMGIEDSSSGAQALFTDYDGDGDPDLFVANYFEEQDFLYRNDGGSFTRVDRDLGIVDASGGRGIASGDFDNDGDLDLFVANYLEQQDFLYRNDGGSFTRVDEEMGIMDRSNGAGALFFDYDNDGDLDLFVTNYIEDQPNFLYRNDGEVFTRTEGPTGLVDRDPGVGAACGDVDGDGDLDLYVVNFDGKRDFLWRNDFDTGNSWLQVTPLVEPGAGVRRAATGAVVWVDFDGNGDFLPASRGGGGIFMQELGGGTVQSWFTLHFGLGDRSGPVSVKVRFPGPGTLEERTEILPEVEVNQRIEVVH